MIATVVLSNNTVNATDLMVINTYEELTSKQNFLHSQYLLTKSKDVYKELSIEELKRYNYNDTQIEAIKSYDDSESQSLKATATMTFSIKKIH